MSPESLELSLVVILTGIVVVFTALVGLTILIWAFGKIITSISGNGKVKGEKNAAAPKAEASTPKAALAVTEENDDETVAVISAAIASILGSGKSFVVRSIHRVKDSRPIWAQAGLLENTKPF